MKLLLFFTLLWSFKVYAIDTILVLDGKPYPVKQWDYQQKTAIVKSKTADYTCNFQSPGNANLFLQFDNQITALTSLNYDIQNGRAILTATTSTRRICVRPDMIFEDGFDNRIGG